jgi:pimeloyl-ACP methyl ester carboxylesterase
VVRFNHHYPRTPEHLNQLELDSTQFAEACYGKYGDYLLQLGSNNVVRDMEEIRQAMGEDQLRFLGYSYGTRLASLYLQMFPEHAGTIILDASMSPDPNISKHSQGQLNQFKVNLDSFLGQCDLAEKSCDATEVLTQLEAKFNAASTDEEVAEVALLLEIVGYAVENSDAWDPGLDLLLAYLSTNDVKLLEEVAAGLPPVLDELDDTAFRAVSCADDALRPTAGEQQTLLAELNQQSDIAAEVYVAAASSCTGWPDALDPIQTISTRATGNAVIIGGTSDARTPLKDAQTMSEVIGAPLITSEHSGHTVAFTGESACVDKQVVSFIREGTIPTELYCEAEQKQQPSSRLGEPKDSAIPSGLPWFSTLGQ